MTLENVRTAKGSRFRRVSSPQRMIRRVVAGLGVDQLERLSQILKESARQLEICGFKSFGEAVVHET